jgi:hypothetical protein
VESSVFSSGSAMRISIWSRYLNHKPERIDSAKNQEDANYLLYQYKLAFGALPGQPAHGKWKLWTGRKCDEPDL